MERQVPQVQPARLDLSARLGLPALQEQPVFGELRVAMVVREPLEELVLQERLAVQETPAIVVLQELPVLQERLVRSAPQERLERLVVQEKLVSRERLALQDLLETQEQPVL